MGSVGVAIVVVVLRTPGVKVMGNGCESEWFSELKYGESAGDNANPGGRSGENTAAAVRDMSDTYTRSCAGWEWSATSANMSLMSNGGSSSPIKGARAIISSEDKPLWYWTFAEKKEN